MYDFGYGVFVKLELVIPNKRFCPTSQFERAYQTTFSNSEISRTKNR
jgi:hypothetical protein